MVEHRGTRIVSADPGLLTPEELLLQQGGRRKTLEQLIAKHKNLPTAEDRLPLHQRCRESIRWFLDAARLKISVSLLKKYFPKMLLSNKQ